MPLINIGIAKFANIAFPCQILNIINGNIVYDIEEDKEYAISDIGTKPFDNVENML